jgi:hypothetical protein
MAHGNVIAAVGTALNMRLVSAVNEPASPVVFLTNPLHGPRKKHSFQQQLYCCVRIRCRGNAFTHPLPRNGLHMSNTAIYSPISRSLYIHSTCIQYIQTSTKLF